VNPNQEAAMSAAPPQVREIFLAAVEKPAAERAAFLQEACGADAGLRQRVEALLHAHDQPGSFSAAAAPPVETADEPPPTAPAEAGRQIGPYKLVQKLGEGGMGAVWVAEQAAPVKRRVALKLIKPGMDSAQVIRRFEAERQALALMDHTHIARVLDAGTSADGRPYFVMELVKGVPITKYCDELHLSLRDRLELFVPVCQAIQHAHQKGIIHRDIKPSNVLVAMQDGQPVPKVIDFGVAKALHQRLTDASLFTEIGQVVGTLEYMSPEQAELSALDIDTRADVYALGVLLYELLTGTTPLNRKQLRGAAFAELLRLIKEQEPPKPSTRLSESKESLAGLAALRKTEPAKLTKAVRGDLDWIVMRCLEKRRDRRYETANGLARDVQRYLANEVVEARPPSVSYRLSKFVRRHKGQVIAASLVLLALVGGTVGTTLGLFEAWRLEKIARDETAAKELARQAAAARVKERDQANNELAQANDNLLNVGARGLLRPLATQVQPNQPLPPLNDQEVEPLWELSAATDERLHLRFVEVALDDPVLRRRLKDRAPFAFQAALGLDPTRRTRVEELLGKRLQARGIAPEEQEQVAFCLAHLGSLDRRLAGRTADALIQAMSKTTDPYASHYLAQALAAVAARLEPRQAARVCGQAAANLAQSVSKTTDANALQALAQALVAVVARLEPKQAATLTQTIIKTTHPLASHYLAQALAAVAARLEPRQAAEVAATLTQAISKPANPNALGNLAQGLAAVAARLEPKQAAEVAATLTQAMSRTTHQYALMYLAQALAAVAGRLEPKQATELCGQAAATLLQAMRKPANPNALGNLAQGLAAVAARLEPKQAAEVAATFTQAISRTTDPLDLLYRAQGLSAVAARLEPKQAAQAAATLIQTMSKATDRLPDSVDLTNRSPETVWNLAQGLSAVLARELSPQTLVDLLKHPCCVGEARRQVLDQLARHYHRPFADQWDFVAYAHQQKLGLDLTTPPSRSRMLP
jgi:serine/threonine protein kinase